MDLLRKELCVLKFRKMHTKFEEEKNIIFYFVVFSSPEPKAHWWAYSI